MTDEAFNTPPSCNVVQSLEYKDRCAYVRSTSDCQHSGLFANYIEVVYCNLRPQTDTDKILCSLLLLTICIIIYIVLGATVENIFCPALKVVAKILGLNEHLAGVTLLAFGNGSPDLIGTFSNLDNAGAMFVNLFGAGLYVVLVVSGLIFVLYPFELQWNNVLRDACFLAFGVIYVDYCTVSDGGVTRIKAICIMSIYILYLMVIFMEQFLLKQSVKMLQTRLKVPKYATAANLTKLQQLRAEAGIEILDRTSRMSIDVEKTRSMSFEGFRSDPNKDLFKQFHESLSPVTVTEWVESSIWGKIFIIITAPVFFLLQLLIPLVNYEKPYHGWSKLLNSIQIPFVPLITAYAINSIASFGGVFIYQTFNADTPIIIPQGNFGENCVVFQLIAALSVLVWSSLTNFTARRSIGVFNFILYALFLLFVILAEFEVIESFAPEKEEDFVDT